MGAVLSTNFKNYDLPVEGSPTKRILISPLSLILSGKTFFVPFFKKKYKFYKKVDLKKNNFLYN